jgi:hypothetical protein
MKIFTVLVEKGSKQMTTQDQELDKIKKEMALQHIKELSEQSSAHTSIYEKLTEEQQEFIKNHRFPGAGPLEVDEEPLSIEISFEEWLHILQKKYDNLFQMVKENLPNLSPSLDFEISIQKILNIKECSLPFAGIVLGRPSSFKTVGIELFRKWKNVFYTDNFSARAFVSHTTTISKDKLAQIDLLPKIKNKLFLTPELSPTFAKKDEELIEILGIMTRVLDGQGYESDTGAHGHRGYTGPHMFVWIGAAVDIPWKVHKYLATLGPKLYFLRLPHADKTEDEYLDEMNHDNFHVKVIAVKESLYDYLNWFEKCPHAIFENGVPKIAWDNRRNDQNTLRMIIRLAKLLGHLRCVVPTRETKDSHSQGIDYAYTMATPEDPSRARTQLKNLARGHGLSQGRNYITADDILLVIQVVMSTASIERVSMFELLIENKGKLSTSQVAKSLNTSAITAKRTMREFEALGLVYVIETEYDNEEKTIVLKEEFNWFLSDEFLNLKQKCRKNFTPLVVGKILHNRSVPETGQRGHNSYSMNTHSER